MLVIGYDNSDDCFCHLGNTSVGLRGKEVSWSMKFWVLIHIQGDRKTQSKTNINEVYC